MEGSGYYCKFLLNDFAFMQQDTSLFTGTVAEFCDQ